MKQIAYKRFIQMALDQEYIDGLVIKSQNGDIDSFSLLYDELLTPVYRFCFFRLPTQEIAEDITSEVFLKVWDNIHSYKKETGTKFTAWVFRIAQNKIIDFIRKNKDTLELKEEILIPDPNSESGKKTVENDFLRESLLQALAKIPATQSQSLILKYFSQLDNKEIGEIMEKSETAVRILQSRGLKAIRKFLPEIDE